MKKASPALLSEMHSKSATGSGIGIGKFYLGQPLPGGKFFEDDCSGLRVSWMSNKSRFLQNCDYTCNALIHVECSYRFQKVGMASRDRSVFSNEKFRNGFHPD